MKVFEQLELQLWQTLQDAQDQPESAQVGALWVQMERAIQGRELKAQLEVSAEAILQMAGVLQRRSRVFDEVVAMRSGADPVMAADAFDRFVRQSMDVDFDRFMEAIARKEHDYPESRELVSVAEMVSKEELLRLIEDESVLEEFSEMELEHDEDVGFWVEIVKEWMEIKGVEQVGFSELLDGVGLSVVKVWLALLLGGFEMRQKGGFYDAAGVAVIVAQ
jgi:hypothetical protein